MTGTRKVLVIKQYWKHPIANQCNNNITHVNVQIFILFVLTKLKILFYNLHPNASIHVIFVFMRIRAATNIRSVEIFTHYFGIRMYF